MASNIKLLGCMSHKCGGGAGIIIIITIVIGMSISSIISTISIRQHCFSDCNSELLRQCVQPKQLWRHLATRGMYCAQAVQHSMTMYKKTVVLWCLRKANYA